MSNTIRNYAASKKRKTTNHGTLVPACLLKLSKITSTILRITGQVPLSVPVLTGWLLTQLTSGVRSPTQMLVSTSPGARRVLLWFSLNLAEENVGMKNSTPEPAVIGYYEYYQCCGSMTFWCGSGSGDPCLWLTDPDPTPDPTSFFNAKK